MKRSTILLLTLIPASAVLMAMGDVDDKIISSRGSLFLNIDADDNEGGQVLEIATDTASGGVGGTSLITVHEDGAVFFLQPGNTTGNVIIGSPGGWPGFVVNAEDGGNYSMKFQNSGVSLGAGPSEVFWVGENDRVGIGTKTPTGGLSVTQPISTFIPTQQGVHMGTGCCGYEDATGIDIVAAGDQIPFIDFYTLPQSDFGARLAYFKNADVLHVAGVATFSVPVLEIRGGADIVEGFESSDDAELEPGTVVVIDPANAGALMASSEPYDFKVAGVVSGANGVNPGIHLGQDSVMDGDVKVAMTGRVYVKCSSENGPIRPGDRLTTASLAGYAMKATDSARSDGSVIGKAMSSLDDETGLVLVLVNLQ